MGNRNTSQSKEFQLQHYTQCGDFTLVSGRWFEHGVRNAHGAATEEP